MVTRTLFPIRGRVLVTTLVTMGWLILALGWIVFAWGRYSPFQNLAGVGICALLFVATVGVMWVAEQGLALTVTVATVFGWLSLALYWIAFAWSRHTWLLNGAVLVISLLAGLGLVVMLWLRE